MLESLQAMTIEALRRLADKCGWTLPRDGEKADIAEESRAGRVPSSSVTRGEGADENRARVTAVLEERDAGAAAGQAWNVRVSTKPKQEVAADREGLPSSPRSAHRFQLRGGAPPPVLDGLPASYGSTRIAALPRDPRCLFLYWDVADEALADARARLGPGGLDASFVLRVYDTTFRLFDGTNANYHLDVPVDRDWKSYFLDLNHPRAVFHVEMGLKSPAGEFVALARSEAAEMPADSAAEGDDPEWMTVRPTRAHGVRQRPGSHEAETDESHPGSNVNARSRTDLGGFVTRVATWHGDTDQALGHDPTRTGQSHHGAGVSRFVQWVRAPGTPSEVSLNSSPNDAEREPHETVGGWLLGATRFLERAAWARVFEGPWELFVKGIEAVGGRSTLLACLGRVGFRRSAIRKSSRSVPLRHRPDDDESGRGRFGGYSGALPRAHQGDFGGASEALSGRIGREVVSSSGEGSHRSDARRQAASAPLVSTGFTTAT